MTPAPSSAVQPKAYIAVLLVLGSTHLLNDLMQSLIPAIYPIIKDKYALDFVQVGIITLTFQIAGSLLQPLVGHYTDQHPMPYSTAGGIIFTLLGLNFGMGGIAAAILGGIADRIGIERVYQLCSFLPLVGLLTLFLPRITDHRTTPPAK